MNKQDFIIQYSDIFILISASILFLFLGIDYFNQVIKRKNNNDKTKIKERV